MAAGQNDAQLRQALLAEREAADSGAAIVVMEDDGYISVNNDYSIKYDRFVVLRFFEDVSLNRTLWQQLFYMGSAAENFYGIKAEDCELDATSKETVKRDATPRFVNGFNDANPSKFRKGHVLVLQYSVNFAFDEKIPSWRFQSFYPVRQSKLELRIPEIMELRQQLQSSFMAEEDVKTENVQSIRLSNQNQSLKVRTRVLRFSNLPALKSEAFADQSADAYAHLKFALLWLKKDGFVRSDFSERIGDKIVERLSVHPAFMGRLFPDFELKSDYHHRIISIEDSLFKLARIYDLVRRHCTFNGNDSVFSSKSLNKLWSEKKGNASDINLLLIKLLQTYGFEARPLLVATRNFATVDTLNFSLDDFNRTVACVTFRNRNWILDATIHSLDFPNVNPAILNTYGMLIDMDENRWVRISDTSQRYRNETILLGHLSGDSLFKTNVYVNSFGYAKMEHVDCLERDSVKGLIKKYFSKDSKKLRFRHFIVANEYMDTLPLAQEFDIQLRYDKTDNLLSVMPTLYFAADTLLHISEGRTLPVNFGYMQEYSLVSQFSFPSNYEVFLMPNNLAFNAFDGQLFFQREFHKTDEGFSQRIQLRFDKSYFTVAESNELIRFLKKVGPLLGQQVLLKRLN
ncbi:MAG: hypothetical protein U0T73_07060 [Chitinophagales bacterium]